MSAQLDQIKLSNAQIAWRAAQEQGGQQQQGGQGLAHGG